jgi:hypothetical protein
VGRVMVMDRVLVMVMLVHQSVQQWTQEVTGRSQYTVGIWTNYSTSSLLTRRTNGFTINSLHYQQPKPHLGCRPALPFPAACTGSYHSCRR